MPASPGQLWSLGPQSGCPCQAPEAAPVPGLLSPWPAHVTRQWEHLSQAEQQQGGLTEHFLDELCYYYSFQKGRCASVLMGGVPAPQPGRGSSAGRASGGGPEAATAAGAGGQVGVRTPLAPCLQWRGRACRSVSSVGSGLLEREALVGELRGQGRGGGRRRGWAGTLLTPTPLWLTRGPQGSPRCVSPQGLQGKPPALSGGHWSPSGFNSWSPGPVCPPSGRAHRCSCLTSLHAEHVHTRRALRTDPGQSKSLANASDHQYCHCCHFMHCQNP